MDGDDVGVEVEGSEVRWEGLEVCGEGLVVGLECLGVELEGFEVYWEVLGVDLEGLGWVLCWDGLG